ncbi:MAG: aminodeoxychorismate/anthranilate synthase component II [Bacteroidetes bacterium GWF2_33_16]|nr:MAG: aminodeoxychorismate/anthranilate synthase component II [Bacteroidetes bacterium GWE2_32_14]OFY02268.1 MAG: aminodeoxychorismate/anthranilate synthase component II [Bacteroidetes bacterium GWF2_33_16]
MRVLIVDNYDSFTYNLAHYIEQFASETVINRNDSINLDEINLFDKIIFSPGPGLPKDSPIMFSIIDNYKTIKPILGVCLGHQAIAEYFGAELINMPEVHHGREMKTIITTDDYIYKGIRKNFKSGRYHSWTVNKGNFPIDLEITAIDNNGDIMSLRHKEFDIRGVQYHPESIMTEFGKEIIKNWVLSGKR